MNRVTPFMPLKRVEASWVKKWRHDGFSGCVNEAGDEI